ncbi:RNA polymerase sigma factor [Larkinella bovis]|uniref:RNA polymerase sigma factor n=1 Tax=Larkinella bovis TaxID=683041 RepID=A0ABW0IIL4_9BACT
MAPKSIQREFVQLIAQHQKLLHSLCSLYFPLLEDRQDLFQEIVLQFWKSYPAFNHQAKVSTWMYRVAINTVFRRLRTEKNRPPNAAFSEATLQIADVSDEREEAARDLYRAIAQLPDLDKALIMLYLEEHSYEEMAHILGLSRTNVSTKISRIKTRLGKLLKQELQ